MSKLNIEKFKSIKSYNAYLISSKAKYFYNFDGDVKNLQKILGWASIGDEKIYILGGGSNVLVTKDIIDGLVIHLNNKKIKVKDNRIVVSSGVDSSLFSIYAYHYGLEGTEFLYGLPGTIGGAIYMNARVYENSISDIIKNVKVLTYNGRIKKLSTQDLEFSYKDSVFQHKNYIIIEAEFELEPNNKEEIQRKMNYNLKQRIKKGHFDYPSCGSVFKNKLDKEIFAGELIDNLNLKGTRIGNAEIFKKHGNFIINKNGPDGTEIKKLIDYIQNAVEKKRNVKLEKEVVIW